MRQWTVAAPSARLEGLTVRIAGLEATMTIVLVRVERADRRSFETILRPDRTSARIEFAAIRHGLQVPAYFRLGVEHILTGIDHLAFVLGLVLLVGINRRLVLAITAFTLAHSLTLGASALGLVHAPSATVEALIALSIVFVACELAKGEDRQSLTRAAPWLIAFTFGLLHGFGFAGALAAIGLPEHEIPLALLLFNLGVEAGQLAFVAAILLVWLVVRGLRAQLPAMSDDVMRRLAGYGLGSVAALWFVERTAAAFA
ncbi:MAG: HupE/UreJ family protein [Novosphingobium sp.]|nr:HupE/UreJ family protein [Novosphingobium sp.]